MFGQVLEEPCVNSQHGRKFALFCVRLYIDHSECGRKVTMNVSENKGKHGRDTSPIDICCNKLIFRSIENPWDIDTLVSHMSTIAGTYSPALLTIEIYPPSN